MGYYYEELIEKYNDIDEFKELLHELESERVFNIFKKHNNEILLSEACDDWYSIVLTKEKCLQLSKLFAKLSEKID